MMGIQETPARLFYDFCLEEHVPVDHVLRGNDAPSQSGTTHLGPAWRVLIKDNAVELFQGEQPAPIAKSNNEFARGLGIVP